MKILGGELKGRRIEMPKGIDIRPTSDKVREALFNIIKEKIVGASVLDLFAGSGAFGIEALSRGAQETTFVDIERRCIDRIKKNIGRLPIDAQKIRIYRDDALRAIKKLGDSKIRFNIIFLDPPYYKEWIKKCLISLDRYDILNNPSLVICEHFKKDIMPEEVGHLGMVRQSRYGDTVLTFYINSN